MLGLPQHYCAGCQQQDQDCNQQLAAVPCAAWAQSCSRSCSHATQHIQNSGLQQAVVRSELSSTCSSQTKACKLKRQHCQLGTNRLRAWRVSSTSCLSGQALNQRFCSAHCARSSAEKDICHLLVVRRRARKVHGLTNAPAKHEYIFSIASLVHRLLRPFVGDQGNKLSCAQCQPSAYAVMRTKHAQSLVWAKQPSSCSMHILTAAIPLAHHTPGAPLND